MYGAGGRGGERKRTQRGMKVANPTLPCTTALLFFSDAANIMFYYIQKITNGSCLPSVSCMSVMVNNREFTLGKGCIYFMYITM